MFEKILKIDIECRLAVKENKKGRKRQKNNKHHVSVPSSTDRVSLVVLATVVLLIPGHFFNVHGTCVANLFMPHFNRSDVP